MSSLKRQINLISFLAALTLVGCQQPGAISTQSINATKVSQADSILSDIPADNPVAGPNQGGFDGAGDVVTVIPSLDLTVSTGHCAAFLQSVNAIENSAANDVNVSGSSQNVLIKSARNIMITGNSGHVSVNSSVAASNVNGNSGRIFLNSGDVARINGNSSEELCVKANKIGSVNGNSAHISLIADSIETIAGGSGDKRITANTIGSIQGNSSTIHIYKAKVSIVRGQSGTICLHDGAQILDRDSSNSGNVRSDCP